MPELREECGVLGIYRNQKGPMAMDCYLGLCALQHRGQESCGIAVNEDGLFRFHLDAGLVSEAMNPRILEDLGQGQIAVGHVRYDTDDTRGRINMQPLVINHRKGRLALANNGALTNYSIPPEDLCIACFSGQYPSDIPDDALRDRYAKRLIRVGELQ